MPLNSGNASSGLFEELLEATSTEAWSDLEARDSPVGPGAAAVASAGIPSPTTQPQNITNTGEINSTDPAPGAVTNSNYSSSDVNCSDLTTGRDNKCWNELNLTQFVNNWTERNKCRYGEAFASCFLRIEGFPGLDCTGIKISTCTSPPLLPGTDPRIWYVAYNIYCMLSPMRCRYMC